MQRFLFLNLLVYSLLFSLSVCTQFMATQPTATFTPILQTATPEIPTATATPMPTAAFIVDTIDVTVPASVRWFDTGIKVQAGQRLIFSASASTNLWGGTPESVSSPDGQSYVCRFSNNPKCLMNEAPYGKLIGRIGENEPFEVGANLETSASTSGNLSLAVNDHAHGDNMGAYKVKIILALPCSSDSPADDDFDCLVSEER